MANRIEIKYKIADTRADVRKRHLEHLFPNSITDVKLVDVYTVDADWNNLDIQGLEGITSLLHNPVTQHPLTVPTFSFSNKNDSVFDWAIEIGYLPGVTDNVGNTARESIEDMFGRKLLPGEGVYTSQLMFLKGNLSREDVERIAEDLANPVIQRVHIKSASEYFSNIDNGFIAGMGLIVPKVRLDQGANVDIVDLLNASDEELITIGKKGIANPDGTRRGPLAMSLEYMKAVQSYFQGKGRNPFDIEVEMIGQSWSEHCRHPKFADPIDDIKEGLFKRYIKGSTEYIRKMLSDKDFCVSVFTDNSGGIIFDDKHIVTHKVETHNSPSALDPFGGAITGIVGVNRDTIGFGMGAKPIANVYGFCFGDPDDKTMLYRDDKKQQPLLPRRIIQDGVIYGVNVGGNCSGIPTPQGFAFHEDRYKGKPLVFVGTVGLIPKTLPDGKPSHEKKARPGDYIVMIGGKVGQDGIHGATFSSEALTSGSPSTAVQIGDPITQKKLSDAVVKEARDLRLYNSITDNGAGGLSSSVGEMAHESGGCYVTLEKVPLKYPGLEPWKIWVSESQERMTLAVPKDKWDTFYDLMERRGVEATVIGEFTSSGKCVIDYNNKNILNLDMDFLKDGLPQKPMMTSYTKVKHGEPVIPVLEDLTESLHSMLSRMNIASKEYISEQFDHEVQGGSVIKPLQGRGRVNGDATILRPVLDSQKGVVLSHALNPRYSDIDTYAMAAAAIDTAVRNSIVVGANPNRLALLDNFCWASPDDPEMMGRLKAACEACYDMSIFYNTPLISGKDSMYNDFKGFDDKGNPLKISVPLTLLISSIGVIDDVKKAVSMDAKVPGDSVYILGLTYDELGGSEYYAMMGEKLSGKAFIGDSVPGVSIANACAYRALNKCIDEGLIASATSVHSGGLGVALAKTAMAGMLGMDIDLSKIPGATTRVDNLLYSESTGRIIMTVSSENKALLEKNMHLYGVRLQEIGKVNDNNNFILRNGNTKVVDTNITDMLTSYRSRFQGY